MKKEKSLKRLSDKDLSKLVGGKKVAGAGSRAMNAGAAAGSTWLYNCWEGTCTPYAKAQALKADPVKAKELQKQFKAKSE